MTTIVGPIAFNEQFFMVTSRNGVYYYLSNTGENDYIFQTKPGSTTSPAVFTVPPSSVKNTYLFQDILGGNIQTDSRNIYVNGANNLPIEIVPGQSLTNNSLLSDIEYSFPGNFKLNEAGEIVVFTGPIRFIPVIAYFYCKDENIVKSNTPSQALNNWYSGVSGGVPSLGRIGWTTENLCYSGFSSTCINSVNSRQISKNSEEISETYQWYNMWWIILIVIFIILILLLIFI